MRSQGESKKTPAKGEGRRKFLHAFAGLGSGAVAGLVGTRLIEPEKVEAAEVPPPLAESSGNLIVRMQQELEQTVFSGRTPSWLMVVDTRKCIGCDACTVACRAENPTGPGGNIRRVIQREDGPSQTAWAIFKPVSCFQCEEVPCARAVPDG